MDNENKSWTRKRPTITLSIKEDNKVLIETLAVQSGKSKSSIVDSMIDYMIANHATTILEIVG